MRLSNLQRRGPYAMQGGRGLSPNSFNQRGNQNVSVHSEHLWNMMQDIELFPDEIYQLLRYEERNLNSYKKSIEREKMKVGQSIDSMKREMEHNIDDLKISIFAELDRIYRNYMEKYATLKGEIMEIKRMKDEIQMNIESRNVSLSPRYAGGRDNKTQMNNNATIMKSMEKNTIDVKKYQMLNYIAELQKQKITPLSDLSRQLVVLTQYENGYYQNKDFGVVIEGVIENFKGSLRGVYDRKYEFIREPDEICQKEDRPILQQLNEPVYSQPMYPPTTSNLMSRPVNQPVYQAPQQQQQHYGSEMGMQRKTSTLSRGGNMEETKFIRISPDQQNITFQWAENINLTPTQTIKSQASDIILCALEVGRGQIAVGSKDGVIIVYDCNSGQKIANLRAHKASICKLALVNYQGKKYLASGSDHGCSSIVLWDTNTWNMRMKIEYHKAAVTAIVDLQDNRSVVSGSYDKNINVYNLNEEGKMVFNLPVNKTSVTAVLLSCNGNKLISCGLDDTVSVYQIMRGSNRQVQTMFLERQIQNNTMICSLVASVLNPDLLFLGTKDGKVKLINIDRGDAYKIYNVCSNAVIEMTIVERQTKPQFPLMACWPCSEECIKIVNTESGKVSNQMVRGYIEFGCGIGPKSFFLSNGRNMAMLSQSRDRQEVNLFKLELTN